MRACTYEKGYITKEDTGGLEITWGNSEVFMKLIEMIAHREGFGDVLADGVMRAAQKIGKGSDELAVYCGKGFAPHGHDPRFMWSLNFVEGLSDTASLWGALPDMGPAPDLGYDKPTGFRNPEEHPRALSKGVGRNQFKDSAMICTFCYADPPTIVKMINAVTGWDYKFEDAYFIGTKAGHMMRAFNILHGATPDDDCLSKRLLEIPADGPVPTQDIPTIAPHFEKMKREFYKNMGWDVETSKPLPETLHTYGLDFITKDLWQ